MNVMSNTRLFLMLTEGCNFRCRHCIAESTPEKLNIRLTSKEMMSALENYARAGGKYVAFTGGEATLCMDTLLPGLLFCSTNGISTMLYTNGWWGREDTFKEYMGKFAVLGLNHIVVSFDEFHAKFHSFEDVKNILLHSNAWGINSSLTLLVYTLKPDCLTKALEKFDTMDSRFISGLMTDNRSLIGPLINYGRAKQLKVVKPEDALALWGCSELRGVAELVTIRPGNQLTYRCAADNPRMTYSYEGNFVDRVLELNKTPFWRMVKRKGLLPLMRKARRNGELDACEFCTSCMAKAFPTDNDCI